MKDKFLSYAAIAICTGTGLLVKSQRRHPAKAAVPWNAIGVSA
jgi:hypothetical protein